MSTATPQVRHHTARLNGIQQHWVTAGEGPPVYLLHGFPETWYGWRKQIPVLAEEHTVIAPDLRGYGATEKPAAGYDKRTMAADVVALMDHLGHERAAVVGHDRGARVGTRLVKDHPDRIERFAALDNVPTRVQLQTQLTFPLAQVGWFLTFLNVPDLPEALIAGREEAFLTHLYRAWSYDPETLSPQEIDVYVRAYRQPGAIRGAASDYRAGAADVAQDLVDADQPIDCPVLALWGADFHGNVDFFDMAQVWQDMAPDVRTVAVPECGHLCQEERPDVVNAELLDFLAPWRG
jgi:haloacetate dehalogenase